MLCPSAVCVRVYLCVAMSLGSYRVATNATLMSHVTNALLVDEEEEKALAAFHSGSSSPRALSFSLSVSTVSRKDRGKYMLTERQEDMCAPVMLSIRMLIETK